MTDIYFQNLQDFYAEYGLDKISPKITRWYMQKNYPEIYDNIIDATSFVSTTVFSERIYCWVNSIKQLPKCKVCENTVRFIRTRPHGYFRYCSQRCSMLDMKTLIGVENSSQLESVKEKKKQASLEKYGVDNVSKAACIKEKIGKNISAAWDRRYKNKKFTADGLTKKQYIRRCQQYAGTQYQRHKEILDPDNLRGKDWHIDHIYSVSDGFIYDVPINILSDITNLRLIPAIVNYRKHASSYKSLEQLYEDYYANHAEPVSSIPLPCS